MSCYYYCFYRFSNITRGFVVLEERLQGENLIGSISISGKETAKEICLFIWKLISIV